MRRKKNLNANGRDYSKQRRICHKMSRNSLFLDDYEEIYSLNSGNYLYICKDLIVMAKISQKVDKLTNSIVNRLSGDSFETDVIELLPFELKKLKRGWKFDWDREASTGKIYKLVIRHAPEVIQGLVSIYDGGDHIYMNLIETARHNFGKNKIYEGVAGNLVAFACQISINKGYDGIVAFEAKTKLIEHYEQTLKAQLFAGNRMFIDKAAAYFLMEKYFNK